MQHLKRIARYQIVSFPNFAFWGDRFDLLFNGRMPHPMLFRYSWYNTGHIHQLSIKDFKAFIVHYGLMVKDKVYFRDRASSVLNLNLNLFATEAIYFLTGE